MPWSLCSSENKLQEGDCPWSQRLPSYIKACDFSVIHYPFSFYKMNPVYSKMCGRNAWMREYFSAPGKYFFPVLLMKIFFLKKWVKCFSKHREGKYLNWNSMMNCFSLLSVAISEQWASPGPQTWEEGTEGQSDLGSPPGAVLQHLAALFHHQHGAGKRSRLKKENQMERSA